MMKFIICAVTIIGATGVYHLVSAKVDKLHEGIPLRKEFEFSHTLPSDTVTWNYSLDAKGGATRWLGRDVSIPQEITDAAGADKFLSRQFLDLGLEPDHGSLTIQEHSSSRRLHKRLGVYVAYSESSAKGSNTGALHYPALCFKGGGWDLLSQKDNVEIKIPGYLGGSVRATVYLFHWPGSNHQRLVFYWMQNGGKIVGDRLQGRLGTFWRTLMGDRVGYLAQVRLDCWLRESEEGKPAETVEQAHERLVEFAQQFLPNSLANYLPEHTESK